MFETFFSLGDLSVCHFENYYRSTKLSLANVRCICSDSPEGLNFLSVKCPAKCSFNCHRGQRWLSSATVNHANLSLSGWHLLDSSQESDENGLNDGGFAPTNELKHLRICTQAVQQLQTHHSALSCCQEKVRICLIIIKTHQGRDHKWGEVSGDTIKHLYTPTSSFHSSACF